MLNFSLDFKTRVFLEVLSNLRCCIFLLLADVAVSAFFMCFFFFVSCLTDNFAHRTAVRHALANDKEWQGKFISPVLPLIEKQHNEVAYLVPWCQLGKPPKEGGELIFSFTD